MGVSSQDDFISTPAGTLDGKGRVCVPVNYRQILASQGTSGVYVRPHPTREVLQCFGATVFGEYKQSKPRQNPLAAEDDEDTFDVFAETELLQFDDNGRARLPDRFIAHAKLGENITFVGRGALFEIWDTTRLKDYRERKRANTKSPGAA